jgi:heat shock transcription factor
MLGEMRRKKCEPSVFPTYLKASEEISVSTTGMEDNSHPITIGVVNVGLL